MSYIIGVDVGGTCTDCVILDEKGRITLGKALSTPPNFGEGILDAVAVAAAEVGLDLRGLLEQTSLFLHSTTVAENAIFNNTLTKAGLITTNGFEETLYIMRAGYGRWSGLSGDELKDAIHTDKPPTLIPLDMVRGVKERTDHKGRVLVPIDGREVEAAVHDLVKCGARSIGVCFLWSFRNPTNELAVKETVKRLYPEVFVTISSELCPSPGEYERTSTVALNSCLGPLVEGYLGGLHATLAEKGFRGSLLVMQSHGGVLPAKIAVEQAVGTIESGPVGGILGSRAIGELLDVKNIIAADMGGTTFKLGVVRDSRIEYQFEQTVFRYHYSLPRMDVSSIGAAGGSVVWLEPRLNQPRVGPMSAGANPGPVCYDLGGEEPTVCDVDLILGYLEPRFFLGGRIQLNPEKAVRVFKARIADPLRMEVKAAAAAVYRLVNNIIYDLVHKATVEKGVDTRNYTLFAFGGIAGLHVGSFAPKLGVKRMVIPNTASVHGAFGLVSSDVVHEYLTSQRLKMPAELHLVNEEFAKLEERALAQLRGEGFEDQQISLTRSVDMRYGFQVHVVTPPVRGSGPLTERDLEDTALLFDELYEEKYGKASAYKEAGREIVGFRVRATGLLRKPVLLLHECSTADPGEAFLGTKKAYFDQANDLLDTKMYDFTKQRAGTKIVGPAIIFTPVTTVLVAPDQTATCDPYKNLILD